MTFNTCFIGDSTLPPEKLSLTDYFVLLMDTIQIKLRPLRMLLIICSFDGDSSDQPGECSQSVANHVISVETIQANLKLFTESRRSSTSPSPHTLQRQPSNSSMSSVSSGVGENTVSAITNGQCFIFYINSYVCHSPVCPSRVILSIVHSSELFWRFSD